MPEPSTLALFALAAAVLVAVPGPNLVYILTRSLSEGRRAGLASVLGVETGTVLHVLAAALGLSALVASSAVLLDVVRYAGAAYLAYLGVRALRELTRRPSLPGGAAGVWWLIRSSKPAGRSSPPLGWFDSIAAS